MTANPSAKLVAVDVRNVFCLIRLCAFVALMTGTLRENDLRDRAGKRGNMGNNDFEYSAFVWTGNNLGICQVEQAGPGLTICAKM